MTRYLSLLALALPLAFVAGCVDGTGENPDDCVDGDCSDTNDCTDGDCVENGEFLARLHLLAPNGDHADYMADAPDDLVFIGDFKIGTETHENTSECWHEAHAPENDLFVSFSGDGFSCALQYVDIVSGDNGYDVDVLWDGVAPWIDEDGGPTCALDPDGEYTGHDVRTSHNDDGEVVIHIDTGQTAPIVGNEFYFEEDGVLLEGWVAWDLSEIYYHEITAAGNEREQTIYLED